MLDNSKVFKLPVSVLCQLTGEASTLTSPQQGSSDIPVAHAEQVISELGYDLQSFKSANTSMMSNFLARDGESEPLEIACKLYPDLPVKDAKYKLQTYIYDLTIIFVALVLIIISAPIIGRGAISALPFLSSSRVTSIILRYRYKYKIREFGFELKVSAEDALSFFAVSEAFGRVFNHIFPETKDSGMNDIREGLFYIFISRIVSVDKFGLFGHISRLLNYGIRTTGSAAAAYTIWYQSIVRLSDVYHVIKFIHYLYSPIYRTEQHVLIANQIKIMTRTILDAILNFTVQQKGKKNDFIIP